MTNQDPIGALEQLAVMRERGLITDAEYQAKRAETLARLGQQPPAPPPLAPAIPVPAPAPAVAATAKKSGGASWLGAIVLVVILAWGYNQVAGDDPTPAGGGGGGGGGAAWSPPAGFTKQSNTVAFRWVDHPTGCIADACWGMEVVTRDGCPTSLYVELSIQDRTGAAIGYTNDVAGAVRAGQIAKLTFDTFEEDAKKAVLSDITCY